MYIVALTGGIGSGKSEAARQFARLNVPVVDTDVIAHELTAAGSPMLPELAQMFGAGILNADGSLNRAALRTHVLDNPAERARLEQLLHPAIYDRAMQHLRDNDRKLQPQYQVLVIPLLFENNRYRSVIDTILVIDCDEDMQVSRAMARSQLTEQEVRAIMAAQTSRTIRLIGADEIIENNGSIMELIEKVNKFHNKLIKTCLVSK
ncbi:dephospho-CoA kinase [Methylotenera sp. G11]|uniref:dephospho-CoA kinase n=1 Tax=Methylotenera sp. G11 TaxID=1506585 RepID=UPI0006462EE4|nr:dephospho-CoA kinase [Methylotenera sp. G11]